MDTVVDLPVVVQRTDDWGFRRQKTVKVPQLQYFFELVVAVPVVQVLLAQFIEISHRMAAMVVERGFLAVKMRHFFALRQCALDVECQFFGALDGEEFFAIESSV